MQQVMIPGCEVSENALRLPTSATDADVREILRFLRTVGGSLNWWVGDFVLQAAERRDRVEGLRRVEERARLIMDELAMPELRVKECVDVCRQIAPRLRYKGLSWTHHREALAEMGDFDAALPWLEQASKKAWNVAEMNRAIHEHKQRRLPGACGGVRKPSIFQPLFQASAAVARLDVASIDDEDVDSVVESTEPLWCCLQQLRERQASRVLPG